MFHNDMIYKGYRLIANVSRIPGKGSGRAGFTATVAVGLAGNHDQLREAYTVPLFASGGSVASPTIAVDAAITHGRLVVDSHPRPA